MNHLTLFIKDKKITFFLNRDLTREILYHLPVLRETQLFRGMPDKFLEDVSEYMRQIFVLPGTVLTPPGYAVDFLQIIVRGNCELTFKYVIDT